MSEDQEILIFNVKIDQMLGVKQRDSVPGLDIPGDSQAALILASQLMDADFRSEIHPQPELRARWISQNSQSPANSFDRKPWRSRWVWAGLVGLVLIGSLLIFRQPVLAAVGRLLGYGYFPQAGFVQLDSARILHNPVKQEHDGRSLTVVSGLATPNETALWVEFSTDPVPPDGAWLETTTGEKMMLRNWNWDPNKAGSRGIHLVFPPLPIGMDKMTLALPEGWRLPLEWIPAAQAGTPSTEVGVAYPTTQPIAQKSPPENTMTPCVINSGMQVCLQAAQTDADGTRVLLKATSQDGQLIPGGDSIYLIAPNPLTKDFQITVTDDLGNVIAFPEKPFDPSQTDGGAFLQPLTFPSVSPHAKQLTLRVPAFQTSTVFPEPLQLQVNLGADPKAGQNLAVDQELKILGQTVRFRQATLEGDGVTSLRLTLISDPMVSKNGVLVNGLSLGKPEGIDDRYGSGFNGQSRVIKVSAELIGPVSGKKTGTLIFPIIGAQVLLLGPFEFTFAAPPPILTQPTETPQVVGGESFTPQPSPTPLALDSYHYTGKSIEPGDLLFTRVGDTTTELYTTHPQDSFTPALVAVLPGQVYQVYVHPDRQGIDYLAGNRTLNQGRFYAYRSAQIYTLKFTSDKPKLLAAFPSISERFIGTEVNANWSFDGRLMIIRQVNEPKQGEPSQRFGWIDLSCRNTGNCQIQYFVFPEGLVIYSTQFSPTDYRVLMEGSYLNGKNHGWSEIFLVRFNSQLQPEPIISLANEGGNNQSMWWLPDGNGFLMTSERFDDKGKFLVNEYDLYRQAVTVGQSENLLHLPFNMRTFTLSPNGKMLIDQVFVPDTSNSLNKLRLFELDTHQTYFLKQSENLNFDTSAFSPDNLYLCLISEQWESVTLINIKSGKERVLMVAGKEGIISWVGWAP